MTEEQKHLIEHLMDIAEGYYTEATKKEDGKLVFKIPDEQPEKQFIQEVFMVCWDLLERKDY